MSKKEEDEIGLKQWITKTVLVTVVFIGLIYFTQRMLHIDILADTFMAITIALCIGFTHESLHYYQAVKLGYKPKWYRTKLMMGFEITHHTKRAVWMKHKHKIAILSYIILVPVSILVIVLGFSMDNLGILVGGIAGLLMHGISFPFEGKNA